MSESGLRLYYASGACSFVPHALLEASGSAFEPISVKLHKGEQNSPEFDRINPNHQVPVLFDGDTRVRQIIAITMYLNDRFAQKQFIPGEIRERARYLETLAWLNNTVHPTFTHVFMPAKFSTDEKVQAAVKEHAIGRYRELMKELQEVVSQAKGQFYGAAFGPVDPYVLTVFRWAGFAGIKAEEFPKLRDFVLGVAKHEPVAKALEREKLKLDFA